MPEIVKQVQAILPGFEQGVQDRKAAEKARRKTKQESQGKLAIKDAVEKAIQDQGDSRKNKKAVDIEPVSDTAAGMVSMASAGSINITGREVSVYLDDMWHAFRRHSDAAVEQTRDQIALTKEDIEDAGLAVNHPDVVESLFTTTKNPTQKQAFAYAKKTAFGHYVVVEAVGGANTGRIFPVEIIQVSQNKWNNWIWQGKTLGEMLYAHDKKKLTALDVAANKKNRVTAAQYASKNGPAPSAFSSANLNITQGNGNSNTQNNPHSFKDESSLTDREILANTLMDAAQNPGEQRRLANYKNQLETFYKTQDELEIAEARLRQARHEGDAAKIREAQRERDRLSAKLTKIDSKLLELKATKPLKELLTRVKADTRTRTRALNRERRSKTELRTKIRRLHEKMSTELLKPREGRYVPKGLLKSVAEVLEAVNTHCFVSMNSSQARFSAFGKAFLSLSAICSLSVRTWVSLLSNARISRTASGSM